MHNTGNPIGSDSILDLYDNSSCIDNYVNSQEDSFPDRFGTKRLTLAGLIKRSMALRNEINDFSGALTFEPEWTDVPMNVSEGVGGEGGALNLQAEALGNRTEINKIISRETLRRTYLEVGLNLVPGSFEQGAIITSTTDVVLHEKTGKCYSGPIGNVPKGTDPLSSSFVDKSFMGGFSHLLEYPPMSYGSRLKQTTYITDAPYFADKTGITPFRASTQMAIDDVFAAGGGVVIIPCGDFLMDDVPLIPRDGVKVIGFGDMSRIIVNTDMSIFEYKATSPDSTLFGFELESIMVDSSVNSRRKKFDIYIENPNFCRITKVRIKSGHTDTQYSDTNVGGIHLKKLLTGTITSFCNWIDDCWIQNNSIWLENITDSRIKGGYVWGHTRQYSIRITGGGANVIESVVGIIPSKYNGGIWLDGSGVNQIRIIGNEFDGNPILDTGAGIFAPQQVITLTAMGNTFWGCDKQGIHATDPVGWTVTGNNFWKCNASDGGYDDILIVGKTFGPNGNTFTGNTHVIDDRRNNPGCAYKELNSGFAPNSNIITNAGIIGSYLKPAILTSNIPGQQTIIDNCTGGEMSGVTQKINSVKTKRTVTNSAEGLVEPGKSLTITINSETQFGSVGGFVGTLAISTTRQNYVEQSTNETVAVVSRGLTINKNVLVTMNGSSGGMSYSISIKSPGTLTFTNTSTELADVRLMYMGVTSLS